MSEKLHASQLTGTGSTIIDGLFQVSPISQRATYVAGLTLLGSLELGLFCSPKALMIEAATTLTFAAIVFGLATVAGHSKRFLRLTPWLLWPLTLVLMAEIVVLTSSVWLGWPLTLAVMDVCRD
ncbi:MAG: hypothetical protein ABI895_16700 [Deltaproteobacteria bacterium]